MVRGALDQDRPAFSPVLRDVVDLEGHPVLSAFYPGAKVLVGGGAERSTEHDVVLIQLVHDRDYRNAHPAGVREPAYPACGDKATAPAPCALIASGVRAVSESGCQSR